MNTYIMNSLKRIKMILLSAEQIPFEVIDSITGELEMMKMEIEQHMTNMPLNEEYKNTRCAAEHAVQKLSEILALLEELPGDKELVPELVELIEDIGY